MQKLHQFGFALSRRTCPRHPLGQLVLPSEVNPCVLPRQKQLHTHVIDAGDLQG
jgi:hypothetical protein